MKNDDEKCSFEGCDEPRERGARGASEHCAGHRQQKKRGQTLRPLREKYANPFDRMLQTGREYHLQDTGDEKEYFRKLQRYVQACRSWRDWSFKKKQRRAERKTVPRAGDAG